MGFGIWDCLLTLVGMDQEKLAQKAQLPGARLARRASCSQMRLTPIAPFSTPLPAEESGRLLRAIDRANNPDNRTRRRQLKRWRARHALHASRKDERRAAARRESGRCAASRFPRHPTCSRPKILEPRDVHEPEFRWKFGSWVLGGVGSRASRSSQDLQHCYVCKQKCTEIHHFYDQMCPACAEFNLAKRASWRISGAASRSMTGGRVKIGYQAGLKLLRLGRASDRDDAFPRDGAIRYAQEPDFEEWQDRLEIFGLDLRHTPSVEAFCREMLATRSRLDFIINNACQTVRRPPGVLRAHDGARERRAARSWRRNGRRPAHHRRSSPLSAQMSQVALLPEDARRAQVDLFPRRTARSGPAAGRPARPQLVAPAAARGVDGGAARSAAGQRGRARSSSTRASRPLMLRTPERDKHIVNVSAMEGQFYRNFKTTRHPHTNMAKAALNMMTRTAAADYHADGIHMNSVDTGWVTDEDPVEIAARKTAEQRFHPPLDIVDGAARIVDPIISGLQHWKPRLGTVPRKTTRPRIGDLSICRVQEDPGYTAVLSFGRSGSTFSERCSCERK